MFESFGVKLIYFLIYNFLILEIYHIRFWLHLELFFYKIRTFIIYFKVYKITINLCSNNVLFMYLTN